MLGKITGRCVMPERYELYKSDAGAEIVFKVDEINDGVYLSDLNAYLITIGVEDERNKYLLSKTSENRVVSLSFSVNKLVTSKSGKVTAQIVFESIGGEMIYHTMIFYIFIKNSVSGYVEPSEPLPSAITALQNLLTTTIEQCRELKNDYLIQAEEYRIGKNELYQSIEKLSPHYEFIEKVIAGYSLLESAPSDFTSNYASYFKTNGKPRTDIDFNYVALTEAEPFEQGKYYEKINENSDCGAANFGDVSYEPNGKRYAFTNLLIYITSPTNFSSDWGQLEVSCDGASGGNSVLYTGLGAEYPKTSAITWSIDILGNKLTNQAIAKTRSGLTPKMDIKTTILTNVSSTGASIRRYRASIMPPDTTILIYGVRK